FSPALSSQGGEGKGCRFAVRRFKPREFLRDSLPLAPLSGMREGICLGSMPHRLNQLELKRCRPLSSPVSHNRKSLMRLVLQSNSTSLYYCWGDQWTPRFKEAHNFGSFNNVVEFLRDSKLQEVELVLIHE